MYDHTRVTFKTFYHAEIPDHVIAVVGSTICLGSWDPAKSLILTEDKDTGAWKVTTKLQVGGTFDWKFVVIDKRNDRVVQWEEFRNRFLLVGKLPLEIEASWNCNENIHCATSEQDSNQPCVIVNSATRSATSNKLVMVNFKIRFVANGYNEVVAVAGGDEALGSWNPEKALVCELFGNEHCRTASVHLAPNSVHDWKLVCLDRYSHHILRWEDGRNRRLYLEQCPVDVVAPWNIKEVIRYSRPTYVMFTPLERKSSDLDCSHNNSNNNNNAKILSSNNGIAKVSFNVEHATGTSGFILYVSGSCEPLGYWDTERALRLNRQESGQHWRETIYVNTHSSFEWKLLILNKGVQVWESRPNRFLEIKDTGVEVTVPWNGMEQIELEPVSIRDLVEVSFKTDYHLEDNEVIAIAGSSGNVGVWDTRKALVLDCQNSEHHWTSTTHFVVDEVVEWKLVVLDKLTLHIKRWEEFNNRILRVGKSSLEVVVPWGKREAIREVYADPKLFLSDDAGVCSMCKTWCQQERTNWSKCSDDNNDGPSNSNRTSVIEAVFKTNYCLNNVNTSVALAGSCFSLGQWNIDKAVLFHKGSLQGDWETVISLPINEPIEWKMLIIDNITRKALLWEDRENRNLTINSCGIEVNVDWNSLPSFKHVPSQTIPIPTCRSCGKNSVASDDKSDDLVPVNFKTNYYYYSADSALAVTGSQEALGCWHMEKAAVMTSCETTNSWETVVNMPVNTDIYWKLVTIEKQTSHVLRWEDCDNRFLKIIKYGLDIFAPWNNKETCSNTKTHGNRVTDVTSDKISSVMRQTNSQLKVKKSVHFSCDPVAEYKMFTENEHSKQTVASTGFDIVENFLE